MEHPLIGDISGLTTEELATKISELNKKLVIAGRTGNGHLCNQVRMAIESYQSLYTQRLEEQYRKQSGDRDFSDKIDIA
jgi:hypothetical protein